MERLALVLRGMGWALVRRYRLWVWGAWPDFNYHIAFE